tara:strand:+ start:1684 stop:2466 length:783 start_codon:yes stop_codon:yes gene_type:complete
MFKPKITIVTSSYFRPDFLRRCIQSVQRQSFEDYEHIVVSDHAPFTKAVCDDFKDDHRIRFVEATEPYIYNLGAVSFNIGIKEAKSDYICYALDDDILYENHVLEHYNYLKNSSNVSVMSQLDQLPFRSPHDTAENILSHSFDMLNSHENKYTGGHDVLTLSHTKQAGLDNEWIPQQNLREWEDNVFIDSLGPHNFGIGCSTALKIQWGGISKKDTNGVDSDYYKLLMDKLIEDPNEPSGYKLISDSPYAYPEFKDNLYG